MLPHVEAALRKRLEQILTPLCQEDNYGQREGNPSEAINEIIKTVDELFAALMRS